MIFTTPNFPENHNLIRVYSNKASRNFTLQKKKYYKMQLMQKEKPWKLVNYAKLNFIAGN